MFDGKERLRDVDLNELEGGARATSRDTRLMAAELRIWRQKYNAGVGVIEREMQENYDGVNLKIPLDELRSKQWFVDFSTHKALAPKEWFLYHAQSGYRLLIYRVR